MTEQQGQLPPAGWYPDHADATRKRFWDGAQWTEHVAAEAPVAPLPLAPTTSPELERLPGPRDLADDEIPAEFHAADSGVLTARGATGTVTFDGKFVTIYRTGITSRMALGKGEKRIPIAMISSVQWKPPGKLTSGYIEFSIPGGSEHRAAFGMQSPRNENAVIVSGKQAPEFERLRRAIENAM